MAASLCAMRSSSAQTSAMRPEMTMRPAQDGLTPASSSRTIFRRRGDVALARVWQGFWLAAVALRALLAIVFIAFLDSAAAGHRAAATKAGKAGTGRAGRRKELSACRGESSADNSGARRGEREKTAIPMKTPGVEVNTGRISNTSDIRCTRVLVHTTKRPPPVARKGGGGPSPWTTRLGTTSAWCCGSGQRPAPRFRKVRRAPPR